MLDITEDLKLGKEFFTIRSIGQFIYNTMKRIDELEELANPTNSQEAELERQYIQFDKYVAIRKELYNK